MSLRLPLILCSLAWLSVAGCESAETSPQDPSTVPPDDETPPDTGLHVDAGARMTSPLDAGNEASEPPPPPPPETCRLGVEKKGFVGTKELPFGQNKRTYDLYIGENYDGSTPLPVLFVFHGDGQDGALIRSWTHLEYGSGGNAVVVYPNNPYRTWDIDTPASLNPDYAYVDAMIEDVAKTVCIDRKRIFGWGLSRGAFFANAIGCHRGNVFRGIVAHAGGGPQSQNPADRDTSYYFTACTSPAPSAMVIHATGDLTVSFATGVDSKTHWVKANGCTDETTAVSPTPCVRYGNCTTGNIVDWCAIGGGHAFWPASTEATWNFIDQLK